jgi:hypothetical protein
VCDGCRPKSRVLKAKITAKRRTHTTTSGASVNAVNAQVRAYEKSVPETPKEAQLWDRRVADGMPQSEAWQLQRKEMIKKAGPKLAKSVSLCKQLALDAAEEDYRKYGPGSTELVRNTLDDEREAL